MASAGVFNTTQHNSIRLLWLSDQLVAELNICTTQSKHKRRTSMPSGGFEPSIPAIERPADIRLRPHGYRDGLINYFFSPVARQLWWAYDVS